MDFKDQIRQIGERISRIKDSIQTEEATKMSMVAPVIQALGYDIFDPLQVVPEFTCDIGTKKGEKIDYALMDENNSPLILWECKCWNRKLDVHEGQLIRYFAVSHARFAILTNGIQYRIYADLDRANVMDEKPFFKFDITKMTDPEIEELKKFSKPYFTVDEILATAGEMKNVREIKHVINGLISDPQDWFVREIARKVVPMGSTITAKIIETFTPLIKKSFSQIIADAVSDRLKTALNNEETTPVKFESAGAEPIPDAPEDPLKAEQENRIVTTEEEIEGYYTVLAAIRQHVDPARVVHRDTVSYFGILLDNSNRKPICRLHFNRPRKYIETFDEKKVGTKHEITCINDIFQHADAMIATVEFYDGKRAATPPPEEQDGEQPAPPSEGMPE